MDLLLTADAMRDADRTTMDDYGLPSFTLMESAGRGCASCIQNAYGPMDAETVLVLCGKGNNGGDGLVVARRLFEMGARVHVVLMSDPDDLRDDPARNLDLLRALQARSAEAERLTTSVFDDLDALAVEASALRPTLYVDALLGTGLTSDLREPIASVVGWLNDQTAPITALDVPTGLHSDTGAVLGDAVRADRTVTMAARKTGLVVGDGPLYAGAVDVVDIGIPAFVMDEVQARPGCGQLTTDAAVRSWWPERSRDAYKYSVGMTLVVGGAPAYTGAPVMASEAAARGGAGYVMCACPETVQPALSAQMTTIPTHALPAGERGIVPGDALDALSEPLERAQAVLVGPGLGRQSGTETFVRRLLQEMGLPTVIDADGLNALAGHLDDLSAHADGQWILTPHAGEFHRLAGEVDLTDRVRVAEEHAKRWNCVLLLKGSPSLVAGPDGRTFVGSTGNAALATAGTGDVLAGHCVGLLAQGVPPLEAAAAALHLGGAAADRYAIDRDPRTMVATDLIDLLPQVAKERLGASPTRPGD